MQQTNSLEEARNYESKYGGRIRPENRPAFHIGQELRIEVRRQDQAGEQAGFPYVSPYGMGQ